MSLADEIRNEIENIKELKITVGDINNHLSVLEGLTRKDIEEREKEAYQRGFEDGKESTEKGCEGCAYETARDGTCVMCSNNYRNLWEKLDDTSDRIEVGDEVIWTTDNITLIVTSMYEVGGINWCDGLAQDGKVYSTLIENDRKTGKHYDIAGILEAMKK